LAHSACYSSGTTTCQCGKLRCSARLASVAASRKHQAAVTDASTSTGTSTISGRHRENLSCRHPGSAPPRRFHPLDGRLDLFGIAPNPKVTAIEAQPNLFTVRAVDETYTAPRIVIAAGLGSRELAPMVGLHMPVSPLQGQIIITERIRPLVDYSGCSLLLASQQ
jgi:hypothetical protein